MITADISLLQDREGLQDSWRSLEQRADCPFFLSWGWMNPWTAELADQLYIIRAHRGDELVGLGLVSIRSETRLKFLRTRVANLNQTGLAEKDVITLEYNGFLLDRRCAAEAGQACLQALMTCNIPSWQELYVHNAPPDFIAELSRLPLDKRVVAVSPAAEVDLKPVRAEGDYLSSIGRSTRYQIRRSMRLYEERSGPLQITRATTASQALDWFDHAGRLNEERWAARGKPGVISFPAYLKMHHALIARSFEEGPEQGCMEMLQVRAGESPIGFLYNFLYRGRVYFYMSGLQFEEDAKLKPGLVAHALAIELHAKEGRDVYDFMAGENRYKKNMGEETPALVSAYYRRPRLVITFENLLRGLKTRMTGQ